MRAFLVLVILGLLFLVARSGAGFGAGLSALNPVLLGYGALFAAGIVVAELLRPLLGLMSASSRFVVVAVIAAFVWVGFQQALSVGVIPASLLNPKAHEQSDAKPVKQVRISPAWDGVFRSIGQVNRMSVGAIIDSAAPLVILQFEEAERLGLNPEALTFDQRLPVSDRKISAALVHLFSVRIDAVEVLDVNGAVAAKGALDTNLIGLSFLSRLKLAALSNGVLVLQQ